MSEQTNPVSRDRAQSPATSGELPKVTWELIRWAVIVVGAAAVLLLYSIYWISDDTLNNVLGLRTRAQLISLGAKFLAIFAAGFWAAAQLILLRQREIALASLRKQEAELRKHESDQKESEAKIRKLDLETRQQAIIQIKLEPTVHKLDIGYAVVTNVIISNTGNRGTRITWADGAFYVRKVQFSGVENEVCFDEKKEIVCRVRQTRNPEAEAVSHFVRAGGTETLAFVVHVLEPAFYLLAFFAPVSEEEKEISREYGVKYPTGWAASQYLRVEQPLEEAAAQGAAAPSQPLM